MVPCLQVTKFVEPDLLPRFGQCPHRGIEKPGHMSDLGQDQRDSSSKTWHTVCPYTLTYSDRRWSLKGTRMLRAEFNQRNNGLVLKLEGRLVSAWAVQVKSLVSRRFVRNGLLVDMSEVTYVDSVGEQLLLWVRDLHAKFVAETCYARDVCERLHLTLKGDADRPVPSATEVLPSSTVAPLPRPGDLP